MQLWLAVVADHTAQSSAMADYMEVMIMSRTKKSVDAVALTVSFSFAGGGMRVYDLNKLPESIKDRLMLHGAAQKLGDSYAGRDDHEDCTEAIWEQLMAGNWGAERGSGLEDKLAEAEDRLAEYIAMSDDEKRTVAKLGVNRTLLEKAVKAAEKAIEKRDAKK